MKKELFRSDNKIIFGICGGVAEYFDIDPTILRLVILFTFIFTGFFPIAFFYILAVFIVPKKYTKENIVEVKPEVKKEEGNFSI